MFQVTLIPGLFQTAEYARAMLAARPHVTADEVENLVAARLARQEILDGPRLVVCPGAWREFADRLKTGA